MKQHRHLLLLAAALASLALAQSAPLPAGPPLRKVHGNTIDSPELPAAKLTFGKDFRYIGSQRVNLYGNADAEQHLFVKGKKTGPVDGFYMVQFEHFFFTNTYKYDYPADHTTNIGALQFIYDVKSWPDYAVLEAEDPASDGAAFSRMLAQHNLAFPKKAVRVRMFHLPTPDHRTELMIIYGEALPENSEIPVRQGGVALDKEAPAAAQTILQDALRDLAIRQR